MTKTAVVALGGNALTLPGQAGGCEEMLANAAAIAAAINEVMDAGWRVVVVHGNGPQIGNLPGTGPDCGTRIEPSAARAGHGR